jgi:hypothetical protein
LWALSEAPLGTWGRRLLDAIFDSLSFLYHPGLRNLAGPYTRAYGMDLGSRITLYGLWRLVALGDPSALPPLAGHVDHRHDLFFAPVVELAARSLPRPFPADDVRFPRRRTFALPGGRTATASLGPDVMIGAEQGGRHGLQWDQYVPGSLHWRGRDGAIDWVRVHAEEARPVDCALAPGVGLTVRPVGPGPVVITTNAAVDGAGRSLRLGRRVLLAASNPVTVDATAAGWRLVVVVDPAQPVVISVAGA